jgi:hypothetical protein
MLVRNNDIGPTTIFSQGYSGSFTAGLPQFFFAGADSTTLTNPGNVGKISSSGSFVISGGAATEDIFIPTICGQVRNNRYLVGSLNCSQTGITPGTNAMFSIKPTTLNIASGTYTGSVNPTPREPGQPSNPSVPWTGTSGTLTLTVASGTITGSATLSPVDPQTGYPVNGPPVNVSYGPVGISSSVDGGSPGTGSASSATGLFDLPSTPTGYSLCGGFLTNGLVIGVVPCGGTSGGASPASYIPATFEASQ